MSRRRVVSRVLLVLCGVMLAGLVVDLLHAWHVCATEPWWPTPYSTYALLGLIGWGLPGLACLVAGLWLRRSPARAAAG